MIKYFCDKCKKEFIPQNLFVLGKIVEKKQNLIAVNKKQPVIIDAQNIREFHLCSKCLAEFKKWLEKPEQK